MAGDFYDWSRTPASNATADSNIYWAENQNPDTVNDSSRAEMARIAEFRGDLAPMRTSGGTGNAYTASSFAGGSGSYRDGEIVAFIVDRTNTSSCTLNVNSRGAVAFRPAVGVEFKSGELQANTPVLAYYRTASNEFLAIGSGYHINAMTSGLLAQSVASRLMRIGDPVLSLSPTVAPGRIRLTESTQTLNKADWPELSSWLAGLSTPYPWGSASTTFNLPPAAGYFLRFAALTTAVDTSGARTAGSTQNDQIKAHTHTGTTGNPTTSPVSGAINTFTNAATSGPGFGVANSSGQTLPNHVHTFTTDSTGGDENRVKNVAFHIEIVASTAVSAGTIAVFGFPLAWDTSTSSGNPGSARVRGNNASLGSITALYVSTTDEWGASFSGVLSAITSGAVIRISKVGAQNNYVMVQASSAATNNTSWFSIPCTVVGSSGSFSSNDKLVYEPIGWPGAAGATGPAGGGLPWTWDTGTTAADPGAGKIRGNNATLTSITEFYVNNADANGATQTTWLDSLDDSDSTVKGTLQLINSADPADNLTFRVSSVSGSSYRTIAVTYVGGAATLSSGNALGLIFSRTGDKGSTGASGTDPGIKWSFASSTTMADPSAGNVRFNNATLASVTQVAISYSCGETGNPSVANWVKGFDDSTNPTVLGTLVIKKTGAPENYLILHVNAALTDNTTWAQIPVTYVDGAGSFSASDVLSLQFSRSGNKGTDGSGSGDVSAAANFGTDNVLIRSDSTLKGVQATGISVADTTNNISGTGSIVPASNDGGALGSATNSYSDLFLASGGVINWNNGDVTATHSANALAFAGASSGYTFDSRVGPATNDGAALGSGTTAWSDLFLASGGVINFDNSNATITHSSGTLTLNCALSLGSGVLTAGTIELGASDTTLARVSAGVVSVEGETVHTNSTSRTVTAQAIELGHATANTLTGSSGDLLIEGTIVKKVGKETIGVPAGAMTPRTTNGAASSTVELTTNDVMLSVLDFDTTTEEGAGFWVPMPKSYNNSTVTFQAAWTAASGSGGVAWGLAAYAFSDDDAMDTAVSGQQIVTDTLITANDLHLTAESSAITIGGTPAAGDWIYFEITREVANGSDTLGVDARLLGIRLFFTSSASTDA